MKIKSIRNVKSLVGKIVLLRADLNVPIKSDQIKSDYKIVAILPTIRYLLRHNSKIIIATHIDKDNSSGPVAKRLGEFLGKKILFIHECAGDKVKRAALKMQPKDIIFLENLRFNPGEEKNDKKFAELLAEPVDIYVNDAFAVSHRNHASVSAIKRYIPSYAGLLLEKEILNLHKILEPRQPLISIIGGAKIQTKISLIKKLAKKSFRILIGGALANNFIAAHGFKIGKSVADTASIKIAAKLAKKYKNIILPVDVITAQKINSAIYKVKPVSQVNKSDIILDIGPRTIKLFVSFIKHANTIIWNGPLGYFENEHFKHGTLSIARFVAARSTGEAFGVVGGGETIEALKLTKMENYIDWVSTGGGAMLTYLGGEKMPGLKGIVK
ncbi:MAG: phosphoglycerate kinase [Candidatus Falkowbacteria bacterium]